jgi:hypothetical protein
MGGRDLESRCLVSRLPSRLSRLGIIWSRFGQPSHTWKHHSHTSSRARTVPGPNLQTLTLYNTTQISLRLPQSSKQRSKRNSFKSSAPLQPPSPSSVPSPSSSSSYSPSCSSTFPPSPSPLPVTSQHPPLSSSQTYSPQPACGVLQTCCSRTACCRRVKRERRRGTRR